MDNLFCIVEAFRKDLYGDDFRLYDKHKRNTLENFSDDYRNEKINSCDIKQDLQRIFVESSVLYNALNNTNIEAYSVIKSNEKDSEQQLKTVNTKDTSI